MNRDTPSITRRLLAGTAWMMAWRMISRSLGFVSMLVLAQLLMPADFGLVAVATAVAAAMDSMSQLGVRDALVRLDEDHREYYDTAFTFQVARGLLTAALLAGLSFFADDLLGDGHLRWVLLLFAAFAIVSDVENIGVVSFSRALDFRVLFLMQVGPRLGGFLVTTALAFWLRDYGARASSKCRLLR